MAKKKKSARSGGKRRKRKGGSTALPALTAWSVSGLARGLAMALAILLVLSVVWVIVYRFVEPPTTYLITTTRWSGKHIHRRPVPLEAIAPALWQTVIGSEDSRFCSHYGFDFKAVDKAIQDHEDGERLRGASTISQQTAKNAFLWPGRNFLRKGIEAYFTVLIETVWSKRRIMEVYLNTIEFGPGVFGAEAASQRYFHKPARNLTPHEAALLAAVLPNPKRMHANAPSSYVVWRAYELQRRAGLVRRQGLARCVGG